MAKPVIVTPHPAPHQFELSAIDLTPQRFSLSGDLDPALVRELLATWLKAFPPAGGVLTPEQVAALKSRGEHSATRTEAAATSLESLDAQTP